MPSVQQQYATVYRVMWMLLELVCQVSRSISASFKSPIQSIILIFYVNYADFVEHR